MLLLLCFGNFPMTVSTEHSHQLSQSQAEGRGRADRHAAHRHRLHSEHIIESVGEVGLPPPAGGRPAADFFSDAVDSGWVITVLLGLDDFCLGKWWG